MAASEKIRVIIVDDIAETRENVRKLLQFEPDVEVVGAGRNGTEGIELARELRPDVVLMDINMPDIDGIKATEIVRRNCSFTQVVILSVQGDQNYMRRAMLAGARDFLTKPPAVDELISAIRGAGKMAQEERAKSGPLVQSSGPAAAASAVSRPNQGKIILVYSPKGGTGCTTLAINLAVAMHNEETPVVLVDGNLQFGDVAVFLNEQSKNSVIDLAQRAAELDPEIVEEVLIHHAASGIRVLAAPSRPEYAENVTAEQFSTVLEYLTRLYSYVVVDTPSSLFESTLEAMDAADAIVLITSQDIPAIKNARMFLDLGDVLKIDRKRILFVMNRYDKRIGITPEKVAESFKHEIVAVFPNEERIVLPSINRGVPFMLEDRTRPLARCILSLAEVIRQRTTETVVEEPQRAAASPFKFGRR
jgi:pilus assembly protein CpaE